MILEYISQKKHLTTFSQADLLSSNFAEGKYSVQNKDGDVLWKLFAQEDGTSWIKINFLELTNIYEVKFEVEGSYSEAKLQYSIDNFHWYDLEQKSTGWTGYKNVNCVFLRLLFKGTSAGFTLKDFKIYGEETYTSKQELLSLMAPRLFPQRYFETYKGSLPEIVTTYLEMLETNDSAGTIKKFFEEDNIKVSVVLIFDESEEGSGAINSYAIDSYPINAASGSTFVGLNTAIINRIASGNAFYDIDGNILPGIGLKFSSLVESDEEIDDEDKISYHWNFGDPYATQNNPNIVSVSSFGEIIHSFTKLGVYDIEFVFTKGDKQFSATTRVEISPSPYLISGPANPNTGDIFTIYNLTKWPPSSSVGNQPVGDGTYAQPYVTLSDGTTLAASYLVDNGDRTFTFNKNPSDTGIGYIKIYDEFYDEIKELQISFD